MNTCEVFNLGQIEYLHAWKLQQELVNDVLSGKRTNTLLLLEHPSVFTIGRRGSKDHILLSQDQLARLDIPVHSVDRGGEVTYHGPGQLVVYPIINLKNWGAPVSYVRKLEEIIIATLKDYGIHGAKALDSTGVWVNHHKIGAIGVKIRRGITHHGLSLNINTDLTFYKYIIPCGAENALVTSMQTLIKRPTALKEVRYSLQYHFGRLMQLRMIQKEEKQI
jgi:lipoate-protein ligase B